MAYVPKTPKGGDVRSYTQPIIQQNFQAISDLIDVNHTGFSDTSPGLHKLITFTQQTDDPTTLAGQMALYAKAIDDPNKTGLFARYPSDGRVVQIDGSVANDGSGGQVFNPSLLFQGWQYLSGGLLMKWGFSGPINPGSGTLVYKFPILPGIPAFKTTPFHMEMCPLQGSTGGVFIQANSNLSYSIIVANNSNNQFYWMALGT